MIPNRMSKTILSLSSVALLCGATAIAQSTMGTGMNTGAQSGGTMSGMSGQLSPSDKMFVKKAAMGGAAEVQLGQLAAQKGGSDDVKQFGQKMVDDHTKLNDQMKPFCEQLGMNAPPTLSPKDQALMNKLQGESGQQFDRTYIRAMVKDHHKDLKEFTKEENTTQDASLKEVVANGKQVIQQHLQMIEQIAKDHHVKAGGMGMPMGMGGQ